MWISVSLMATITILTLVGDYCIKLATNKETGIYSSWFVIGALLYGIPAVG